MGEQLLWKEVLMGKKSINGPFSLAMFDYRMVVGPAIIAVSIDADLMDFFCKQNGNLTNEYTDTSLMWCLGVSRHGVKHGITPNSSIAFESDKTWSCKIHKINLQKKLSVEKAGRANSQLASTGSTWAPFSSFLAPSDGALGECPIFAGLWRRCFLSDRWPWKTPMKWHGSGKDQWADSKWFWGVLSSSLIFIDVWWVCFRLHLGKWKLLYMSRILLLSNTDDFRCGCPVFRDHPNESFWDPSTFGIFHTHL